MFARSIRDLPIMFDAMRVKGIIIHMCLKILILKK